MELNHGRRTTAVFLSILYPGLGHAYVRSWRRALCWYLGGFGLLLVASPELLAAVFGTQGVEALLEASRQIPVETLVAVVISVRVLGTADVWLLLTRRARSDGKAHCESCARESDPDIDFCPWCLDAAEGQ